MIQKGLSQSIQARPGTANGAGPAEVGRCPDRHLSTFSHGQPRHDCDLQSTSELPTVITQTDSRGIALTVEKSPGHWDLERRLMCVRPIWAQGSQKWRQTGGHLSWARGELELGPSDSRPL